MIDYKETLEQLNIWIIAKHGELRDKMKLYDEVCKAIETGEGGPNNLALNAAQVRKLQAGKAEIEVWIEAACELTKVEPVEIQE